jgi:teichuronic acid biosynthesis glycosyltransferase TuaC
MTESFCRILHIVPLNSRNEIPIWLVHQINSLEINGVRNIILGFKGSEISIKKPIQSFKRICGLFFTIHNSKHQIVHAHWGSLLGFLVMISNFKKKPFVITLRGSDVNRVITESYFKFKLKTLFTRYTISRANFVICVSENLFKSAQNNSKRFAIIPDGTPRNIFYPRDQISTRKKLGWDVSSEYIVFHCGLRPIEKNLALASAVLEIVEKTFEHAKLVIIENDKNQIELAEYYSAANLLLFTSTNEGSPNVVREAIACGCPVVSVDVGDTKKWVEMSNAGEICNYDPDQLALAVTKQILRNSRADSEISHYFSCDTSIKKILDIYETLEVTYEL